MFVGGGDWYRSTCSGTRARYVTPPEAYDTGIPKAITANDVQRLLDSCDISDPAVVRDYAILMLVARVGLRSIEAARLQLDDLDWRAGRIVLRGKASREDGIPLPADVGEALSAYLRQARPATGEPPGVSAAVPVRPSPPATDPRRHRTPRFPPWPGGKLNLSVAADGTVVIRPNRAKLGPIIR